MNPRVLLIDDDRRLAEMVVRYLGQSGMVVEHRGDAASGLAALETMAPDLVLLDLMLPDADGLDVCRRVRVANGPAQMVPILMLTARGEITDRVVGLELGADDYLSKPFEPRELLARVRALLRRAGSASATAAWVSSGSASPASASPASASSAAPASAAAQATAGVYSRRRIRLGALEIDPDAREARVRGVVRTLTAYQFDLQAVQCTLQAVAIACRILQHRVGNDGGDAALQLLGARPPGPGPDADHGKREQQQARQHREKDRQRQPSHRHAPASCIELRP